MSTVPESSKAVGWREFLDPAVPIRIGISSCLLGEEVRFDGGHCRDRFLVEVLGPNVKWVSVCPEMGIGMASPRPTIRLVREERGVRLIEPKTGTDHTDAMQSFAETTFEEIQVPTLDGYVLKKNSPSCGMERLPIYQGKSKTGKDGRGIFAAALMSRFGDLPVEEEGRMNDPRLRESFVGRVFCRNRWRSLVARGVTRSLLVEFHTRHKLLLRAHDETSYQKLGGIVGSAGTMPDNELFQTYGNEFLHCIGTKPTIKRHANVLQHVMGYFKTILNSSDKHNLLNSIEDYRLGLIPLIVPVSLLRFNAEQHGIEYLLNQIYFDPYPKEWMLRNFT